MNCKLENLRDHQYLQNVDDQVDNIRRNIEGVFSYVTSSFSRGNRIGQDAVKIIPVNSDIFNCSIQAAGNTGKLLTKIQIDGENIVGIVTLWKNLTDSEGNPTSSPVWQLVQPAYEEPYYKNEAGEVTKLQFEHGANSVGYCLGLTFLLQLAKP